MIISLVLNNYIIVPIFLSENCTFHVFPYDYQRNYHMGFQKESLFTKKKLIKTGEKQQWVHLILCNTVKIL